MEKKYFSWVLLCLLISCKNEVQKKAEKKEESHIQAFVQSPPINDPTFHQDTTKEYEYRIGESGDYTYNYNTYGIDADGNEVKGSIVVHGKYGNGVIINYLGEEIEVEVEWVDYGKLKAVDNNGNEYELEVDED